MMQTVKCNTVAIKVPYIPAVSYLIHIFNTKYEVFIDVYLTHCKTSKVPVKKTSKSVYESSHFGRGCLRSAYDGRTYTNSPEGKRQVPNCIQQVFLVLSIHGWCRNSETRVANTVKKNYFNSPTCILN